MMLYRSALCALVMFVAVPVVGGAEAETLPSRTQVRIVSTPHFIDDWQGETGYLQVLRRRNGNIVTSTMKSEAGSEDVTLVESDAWLHGSAKIGALPKTDATLTLTLYDKGSASLMSFSGTLGTDGAVTLTADETKEAESTCGLKTGCTSDTSATTLDIEVLAGEVFAASGGYELGLDLAGVDTYEVAYAAITVTESSEVTTCDRVKVCTTTGSSTTTKAEVDWDEIGAVWEGELSLDHEGAIDVKVKSYDASGEEVENTKVALRVPWIDGGEGINVLAVDEDPLTTVGLLRRPLSPGTQSVFTQSVGWAMAVASGGWTTTTAPVAAEVELDNGETITIPLNSYQRGKKKEEDRIRKESDRQKGTEVLVAVGEDKPPWTIDGAYPTLEDLSSPLCAEGTCVALFPEGDGAYALSVSVYGTDAATLPDDQLVTVTLLASDGNKLSTQSFLVEFDDEVTAVFANEVSFSEDPIGLDLSGQVSLLGAADSKGKQKTLAKGKFYGAFSRDGDGDLELAGADKNGGESEGGSVVVVGNAVGFELTDTDGDGWVAAPPIVALFGDIILGGMPIDFYH